MKANTRERGATLIEYVILLGTGTLLMSGALQALLPQITRPLLAFNQVANASSQNQQYSLNSSPGVADGGGTDGTVGFCAPGRHVTPDGECVPDNGPEDEPVGMPIRHGPE